MLKKQPRPPLISMGGGDTMFEDADKDIVMDPIVASKGVFVNIDRVSVQRYISSMSEDDKHKMRQKSIELGAQPLRYTEGNAMVFFGDIATVARENLILTGNIPQDLMEILERITAAWHSDFSYQHYVFVSRILENDRHTMHIVSDDPKQIENRPTVKNQAYARASKRRLAREAKKIKK